MSYFLAETLRSFCCCLLSHDNMSHSGMAGPASTAQISAVQPAMKYHVCLLMSTEPSTHGGLVEAEYVKTT